MSEHMIPLNEATEAQLREFATTHLGMDIHPNARADSIRAKIQAAWQKDEIPVAVDEGYEQDGAPPPPPDGAAVARRADEFIVYIERQDTFDGDEPVPLGCNGVAILVPRGRWCAVPIKFLDSLRNAVEDRYDPLKDGGMGPVRKVPRYPHQIWTGPGEPDGGVLRPRSGRGQLAA